MFHRRNKVAVENSYRAPIYPAPQVGYASSTTIQSDRVLVQFSVPDHEWNELENSKKWKGFVKRLEECQREQIRNKHLTGNVDREFEVKFKIPMNNFRKE